AVAHEHIRTEADEQHRLLGGQLAQEGAEILQVGRRVEEIRGPAGAPAHMAAHRLVALELSAQSLELQRLGHVHASCAGTLPIEPAPMVSTTSPGRAIWRIVCGMSPISSLNTGSTLPPSPHARASERAS